MGSATSFSFWDKVIPSIGSYLKLQKTDKVESGLLRQSQVGELALLHGLGSFSPESNLLDSNFVLLFQRTQSPPPLAGTGLWISGLFTYDNPLQLHPQPGAAAQDCLQWKPTSL